MRIISRWMVITLTALAIIFIVGMILAGILAGDELKRAEVEVKEDTRSDFERGRPFTGKTYVDPSHTAVWAKPQTLEEYLGVIVFSNSTNSGVYYFPFNSARYSEFGRALDIFLATHASEFSSVSVCGDSAGSKSGGHSAFGYSSYPISIHKGYWVVCLKSKK